ncbi:MAG: DUF4446 family protein [Lachnospiraceae bacterium]|nr:DUF4446 family protein [Lachnospiraceae bacterium]
MNSNILNSIGLGNVDIAYIFIGMIVVILLLLILVIVQMTQTSKLKKRINKFMQGKDGKSLETDINGLFEDNQYIKVLTEENKKDIRKIYRNMEYAFQKVGIVKYDAFQTMGGMLSFSLALLNDHDDGFIMNSVHSSDGCYSYTKQIKDGQCDISLGEEEEKALEMALNSNKRVKKSDKKEQ